MKPERVIDRSKRRIDDSRVPLHEDQRSKVKIPNGNPRVGIPDFPDYEPIIEDD